MTTFPKLDRICIVDGSHGIYIPQRYAVTASADDMATEEQRDVLLEGPEHPLYWDVWEEILRDVEVTRGESKWVLEEDGDLFLVRVTD